jgi:hypothetical protein
LLRLLDPCFKVIPGREDVFYKYAQDIEKTVAEQPDCLAVLKLHYLRWVLLPIQETYLYQGIFDTDFDKYTEDAITLFSATGLRTVFENLEGFPTDWQTNAPAFIKFVRDHLRKKLVDGKLAEISQRRTELHVLGRRS